MTDQPQQRPTLPSSGIRMVLGSKPSSSSTTSGLKRPSAFVDDDEKEAKRERREMIESIEGQKVKTLNGEEEKEKGVLVIPVIRNNIWRVNGDEDQSLPPVTTIPESQLKAQARAEQIAHAQTNAAGNAGPTEPLQYGLNVSKAKKNNTRDNLKVKSEALADTQPMEVDAVKEETKSSAPMSLEEEAAAALLAEARNESNTDPSTSNKVLPILAQNAVPGLTTLSRDEEKFLHDVSLRPDSCSLDEYERVPVEEFGAALLRGMGWKEGTSVGKNGRGIVEPVLVKPRPHLLGLGATPTPELEVKHKKYIKPGEKRVKPDTSSRPLESSRSNDSPRNRYHVDDSRDKRSSFAEINPVSSSSKPDIRKGSYIIVNEGRHRKKRGTVLELKDKKDGVALDIETDSKDREVIRVWLEDVSLYTEEKKSRTSDITSSSKKADSDSQRKTSWLHPHIRVRLISKSFKDGKYYNQKGIIQDVVTGNECTVRMDTGNVVESVLQRHLETYIPSAGKSVLIVSNKDRSLVGQSAKILEKDNKKEVAIVQLEQDCSEVLTVKYDELSEYVPEHPY